MIDDQLNNLGLVHPARKANAKMEDVGNVPRHRAVELASLSPPTLSCKSYFFVHQRQAWFVRQSGDLEYIMGANTVARALSLPLMPVPS